MCKSIRPLFAALVVIVAVAAVSIFTTYAYADGLAAMGDTDIHLAQWANVEREWNKLGRFHVNAELSGQAQLQSDRMAVTTALSHSSGGELGWFLGRGWSIVGENVAATSGSPWSAHLALLRSPTHLANLLNPAFCAIGTAARQSTDGRWYVTQVFGGYPGCPSA